MDVETIRRPADSQSLIFQLLQKARTNLIETGSRNRLVHHPKGGRTKSIEVIDEVTDEVFRTLLRNTRSMSFLPGKAVDTTEEKSTTEVGIYIPPPENGNANGAASRHTDSKLQTRLTPEGLQRRLLTLFRDARTLEEEQGVNVLYLALGFLQWYEAPSSDVQRNAPLILLPVELVRDNARSAFKLRFREEDLSANIALEQRLKLDFGITLPPLPDDDEWIPTTYFSAVSEAVQSQPRWLVEPNSIMLGLFSFSKLVMYLDLDPQVWPDQKLADHPLIRSLMADGFPPEEPLFSDDVRLDEILHPSNTIHVVDADASQSLVIETVRRGRNLVVQGPPGTGKSQTIANVIAAAVHSGKKVLFIAEKLAALNVVHSRLARIGLAPICLELHSRSANKRAVLEELKKTLDCAPHAPNGQSIIEALSTARDKLNSDCAILNTPLSPSGVTPYRALGVQVLLSSAGCPPPELDLPEAQSWTEDQTEQIAALIEQYVDIAKAAGLRTKHPWRGTRAKGLQPADQQRLLASIEGKHATVEGLAKAVANASTFLGSEGKQSLSAVPAIAKLLRLLLERPKGAEDFIAAILTSKEPKRLAELAHEGQKLRDLSSELAPLFVDSAWSADAGRIRNDLAAKGSSTFGRLSGTYRSAQKEFLSLLKLASPAPLEVRLEYLDLLIEAQRLKAFLISAETYAAGVLGSLWRYDRTDFPLLGAALIWVGAVKQLRIPVSAALLSAPLPLDQLGPFADYLERAVGEVRRMLEECAHKLDLDLRECFEVSTIDEVACSDIAIRSAAWLEAPERLDEWTRLNLAEDAIRERGAGSLVQAIRAEKLPLERATTEVLYTRAEQIWKSALALYPQLALLDGEQRSRLVDQFKDLEVKRRNIAVREVLSCHAQGMPRGSVGEMGTIRSEIARRRGHMPVRKLMQRAGRKLQEIKPVMLMSPLSVAQFLPPGSVEFDLLLMDEASQVKPEDALGAIARAQQVVVVGDNKQLPPTSFFDRMISGDEEPDEELEQAGLANTGDLESILKLCEARGMPGRMLTWHYRSRHPSLIEVSNHQFYENRLFLPPAPVYGPGHNGFFVRRVNGSYDRGGARTNRVEADAIVAAIANHASTTPERTLGIVTFSIPQKTLIEDLLEVARRQDPVLESFLTTSVTGEPVFVKNLENVQGDERDVIMVSVGYGPRISGGGLDSMGFGPVSSEGGERRLNVLFTRARFKCEVFVSFASGDIDLARTTQLGPAVLKRFLKFGETGFLDVPAALGGHDSPFEEAVAVAIADMGYEVDAQVGSAGFRIDLAVKHPDQPGSYLMAIECDGAAYHSARWARERDRLRQQVLEDLGWCFHRIWSTDWFRRTGDERRKLKARLDAVRAANPVRTPKSAFALPVEIIPQNVPTPNLVEEPSFPAYSEAVITVDRDKEPHEVPLQSMALTVAEIVKIEGPVHQDEIARRVARAYGKDRTGSRISEAVLKGLRRNRDQGVLDNLGTFWHLKGQTKCQVRNRANASLTLKRGDMVPHMEIEAAIAFAFDHNGSMTEDQLVVAVSRLFGFDRAGPEFKVATNRTIADLIQRGTIKVLDDILSIARTSPRSE